MYLSISWGAMQKAQPPSHGLFSYRHGSKVAKYDVVFPGQAIAYLITACLFSDLTRICLVYRKTVNWTKGPLKFNTYELIYI